MVLYNLADNNSVASVRDSLELQKAQARVEEVAQDIADEKFHPTPGFHCSWCPYRNLCPETEKRLYSIK